MLTPLRAVHVAAAWLTVVPVPAPTASMDRHTGGAAIAATPVVGIVLGAAAAGLAWPATLTSLPTMLIGALTVSALLLVTRGMHLDGLADTADGLGCYGPPERVAEVMRSGTVGPFGVGAVAMVLLIESLGIGALIEHHRFYDVALAIAVGRVAAVVGARVGLPPAHSTGFGALVAGTQRTSVIVWSVIAIVAGAASGMVQPDASGYALGHGITAAATVVVVLVVTWLFTAHCARRMGGITGDVLGASIELGVTLTLIGLLI